MSKIDHLDKQIMDLLIEDSRLTYKEIGNKVHLTGQAVGARVRKLEDLGIIQGYTLRYNHQKIGDNVHAMVTVFLNLATSHHTFIQFVHRHPEIVEVHRVSGEGCYWMNVYTASNDKLNAILEELLQWGNYRVNLSLEQVK